MGSIKRLKKKLWPFNFLNILSEIREFMEKVNLKAPLKKVLLSVTKIQTCKGALCETLLLLHLLNTYRPTTDSVQKGRIDKNQSLSSTTLQTKCEI